MSTFCGFFLTSIDVMSTLRRGWFKNPGNVDITSRLDFKNLGKHFQYRHNGKSACSYKVVKHPSRDGKLYTHTVYAYLNNVLYYTNCTCAFNWGLQLKLVWKLSQCVCVCVCACASTLITH